MEDIQQFQVEDFAKRYFSTHRAGFLFRRRIPVEQLMTWQKVCGNVERLRAFLPGADFLLSLQSDATPAPALGLEPDFT